MPLRPCRGSPMCHLRTLSFTETAAVHRRRIDATRSEFLPFRRKMARRKRPAGTRLQVRFEAACCFLRGELHRNDDGPRTVIDRVTRWSAVMPIEPRVEAVRDADVVTRGVGVASKDVDDPLWYAVHAPGERTNRTRANASAFSRSTTRAYAAVSIRLIRRGGRKCEAGVTSRVAPSAPRRDSLRLFKWLA